MTRVRLLAAVTALAISSCAAPSSADMLPGRPDVVVDDFDGPSGSLPNPALWDYDIGPWQDDGLQRYTNSPDNVRLDGQGNLVIQARPTPDGGYTSARPVTRGKLDMQYGRITARIKFPSGQGIWPAFWMLGSDFLDVGWPFAGEIDMMELVNNGSTFHVALHGPQDGPQGRTDYYGGVKATGRYVGTKGPIPDLTQDFHEYWLDWRPDSIVIGVDDRTLGSFSPASLPPGGVWEFNKPMYVLMNIAVGGPWPGPPDATTPWPATMLVDWFKYEPLP